MRVAIICTANTGKLAAISLYDRKKAVSGILAKGVTYTAICKTTDERTLVQVGTNGGLLKSNCKGTVKTFNVPILKKEFKVISRLGRR